MKSGTDKYMHLIRERMQKSPLRDDKVARRYEDEVRQYTDIPSTHAKSQYTVSEVDTIHEFPKHSFTSPDKAKPHEFTPKSSMKAETFNEPEVKTHHVTFAEQTEDKENEGFRANQKQKSPVQKPKRFGSSKFKANPSKRKQTYTKKDISKDARSCTQVVDKFVKVDEEIHEQVELKYEKEKKRKQKYRQKKKDESDESDLDDQKLNYVFNQERASDNEELDEHELKGLNTNEVELEKYQNERAIQVMTKGSLDQGDQPLKILKLLKRKDGEYMAKIHWMKRTSGIQPGASYHPVSGLKTYNQYARMLISYYEANCGIGKNFVEYKKLKEEDFH